MINLLILGVAVYVFISNLYAATERIDNNATNKEVSKLISQVAPKQKTSNRVVKQFLQVKFLLQMEKVVI